MESGGFGQGPECVDPRHLRRRGLRRWPRIWPQGLLRAQGTLTMPPHPVAGCVLEVLVLLVTTLHQSGKCVVVKVVVAALLFPVATSAGILLCEAALSILLPKLGLGLGLVYAWAELEAISGERCDESVRTSSNTQPVSSGSCVSLWQTSVDVMRSQLVMPRPEGSNKMAVSQRIAHETVSPCPLGVAAHSRQARLRGGAAGENSGTPRGHFDPAAKPYPSMLD